MCYFPSTKKKLHYLWSYQNLFMSVEEQGMIFIWVVEFFKITLLFSSLTRLGKRPVKIKLPHWSGSYEDSHFSLPPLFLLHLQKYLTNDKKPFCEVLNRSLVFRRSNLRKAKVVTCSEIIQFEAPLICVIFCLQRKNYIIFGVIKICS